jgi:hypothetical protein
MTKALKHGWTLSGNYQQLSLKQMEDEIFFNRKTHQRNGHIFAIEISLRPEQAMMTEYRTEMTVKQAHSILGHVSILQTLETAKNYGWKIKDLNETFIFEGLQIAKAKRLAVRKEERNKSTISGERLMIDISYTHQPEVS